MDLFSSPSHLTTVRSKTRADQAAAADPTASAWVSANAGTGKTYVLTMRVLVLDQLLGQELGQRLDNRPRIFEADVTRMGGRICQPCEVILESDRQRRQAGEIIAPIGANVWPLFCEADILQPHAPPGRRKG